MSAAVTCRACGAKCQHVGDEAKDGGTLTTWRCVECRAFTRQFAGPVVGRPAPRVDARRLIKAMGG